MPVFTSYLAGWVHLGFIRKFQRLGAIVWASLCPSSASWAPLFYLFLAFYGLVDFLAKKGNYENNELNLLSYMIFFLGNLAPIITSACA